MLARKLKYTPVLKQASSRPKRLDGKCAQCHYIVTINSPKRRRETYRARQSGPAENQTFKRPHWLLSFGLASFF